ncbi:MAG: FtsQ-type POTRA domain-containing protein [Acutalibacteraceae bacterium]
MNDSQDNTGAFGEDGFDWSSESKKLRKNFDSFGLDSQPYYDGFDRKNKNGKSVFSDDFYRPSEPSFLSDNNYSASLSKNPLRDDSVYNHSEIRRRPAPSGQPKKTASQKKPSDNRRPSDDKKKTTAPDRKKQTSSGTSQKKRPAQSQKNPEAGKQNRATSDGKTRSDVSSKSKSVRKTPAPKSKSKAKQMADAGEKRRREKSIENYDKAIRQGKSKDELRKIRLKKKRRARKMKIAATVCAVFVFAVMIALIFCYTKGAPIEKIVIEGASLYKNSEILKAASISKGDNMLMIRQKETNEAVTKALPYISEVKVDYQLPDTLRLVISETTDKYYIVNGEGYICVDKDDKVVSDVKKKVKGKRYRIEGLEKQNYEVGTKFIPTEKNGNEEKYKIAKKLADAIDSSGLKNCNVINVENTDRIFVVYNNKVWMYFKADSDFEYEMRFAAQAINDSRTKEIISSSEKCYIDLRLGNQAVFKTGELD